MHHRAIVHAFGPAEDVVGLETYSPARLPDNQVRVRLVARPINPSDIITISGAYRSRTPLPFLPGFEGVGVVEACGAGVEGLNPGQRVLPIGSAGTWQAFKDSEPRWCLAVPDSLCDLDAAMSYVNPMTAWLMLHERVCIAPGMRLAVTAAASTIGQMLIRMAAAAGARPVALVRGAASLAAVCRLGVDDAIDVAAAHGGERIARLAEGDGLDAVLDCVGGRLARQVGLALRPRGCFVHYGLLSGEPIPASFRDERPDVAFSHFHLREWVHRSPPAAVHAVYDQVAALVAAGVARSTVRETYPLADIRAALSAAVPLQAGGKVLLVS